MTPPEKLSVWIVEDNRLLRESLAELVEEQEDMTCSLEVDCCEDFLVVLEQDPAPDIVLMDIGLPGKTGIEGVMRVSSMSPSTKVIILTIHAEDDKVFDAICAGATGYLLKPSPPEKNIEAVREVHEGAAPINPHIARKILAMFSRLTPPKTSAQVYGLTAREKEILLLLVDGLTTSRIAGELRLSYHTISNHLRNIYRKLHVRRRSRAVAKALKEDLV